MSENNKAVKLCCESIYDQLFHLESIIKITKDACLDKEFQSVYYNLSSKAKYTLSEERNNYINMLTIALDKISELKAINDNIENELSCL